MILMGHAESVGMIHGVCTRPEFRKRGYLRAVMEEVMQHCAGRYRTLLLCTNRTAPFEPFGFRRVQEFASRTPFSPTMGTQVFRPLDWEDPLDVRIITDRLHLREPLSRVVGVLDTPGVFVLTEIRRRLYYTEDLDLVISMELENTTLKLFDVVGHSMCSLDEILRRLRHPIDHVLFQFCPDRFNVETAPEPCTLQNSGQDIGAAGPSLLMVWGKFDPEGEPFMLPRTARC